MKQKKAKRKVKYYRLMIKQKGVWKTPRKLGVHACGLLLYKIDNKFTTMRSAFKYKIHASAGFKIKKFY